MYGDQTEKWLQNLGYVVRDIPTESPLYLISRDCWMSELLNISRWLAPPPPPRMYKGSHAYSHFLGKGSILAVCLGKIFPRKRESVFFLQSPEICGIFQKLPEKLWKGGYDLYTYFSEPSIASRENRALVILYNLW